MAINRDSTSTKRDYTSRSGTLGRILGFDPSGINLDALAADMFDALGNHRNVGLNRAAQKLGAMIFTALPAYRTSGAAGARLPKFSQDHDNRVHHLPRPDGGDEITQDFTWDSWATFVTGLGAWITNATGNNPGMYRLEDAAVGLILDNPNLNVGPRTVTFLAGAYGLDGLAEIIDEFYSVGSFGHMPLDAPDDEDNDVWDDYDWTNEDDQPQAKPSMWSKEFSGWPADYASRR